MFSNITDKIRLLFRKDKEPYLCFYKMLGFYPRNIEIYQQALLHKSSSIKAGKGRLLNNERLEFLGDAILDAILEKDPGARVACETTCSTGLVHIMGEITTSCYVDIPCTAREVIRSIGYDRAKYGFEDVIGESDAIQKAKEVLRRMAVSESPILLIGETGTGKEVLAKYIHRNSSRADAPIIEINCAALPENLLEAELFGYTKGAFTGALNTGKPGLIEAAHGGTLFLDEINSLPLALQGKFLRVLESHKSKRLGAVEEQEIDFRLLAATNQNLKEGVLAGTFRADLYYRLNVIPLELPPLRERREDIAPLATFFLDYYCKRYSRTKVLSRRVIEQLKAYDWPGNIRELKNVVERLLVTSAAGTLEIYQDLAPLLGEDAVRSTSPEIYPADWEAFYQFDPEHFSLKAYMEFCEKHVLADALKRCPSSYKAAALLKTDQSTIVRKRKKYGL